MLFLYFISIYYFQYYQFIEIAIKQCRSGGINCKIHDLTILGRRKTEADDTTNFPYLALDNDHDYSTDVIATDSRKNNCMQMQKDLETKVYVWGLNDKDQLGGLRGSKVNLNNLYILLSST